MKTARTLLLLGLALFLPLTASAASVAIIGLTPGDTIQAASNVSLTLVPNGISYPSYRVSDSFANSSVSANNINPGGNFSWTPWTSDAGTHVLTFTVVGSEGQASVAQTITVLPPPSMTIGPLSPGSNVMPGTALTFTVSTSGFTNPTFTVGDTSSNPSVQPNNIDASGNFSWTPTQADNGDHTITVYVSDAKGHSASKSVSVHVGPGPSLSIVNLAPGVNISPGQVLTFTAVPSQYQPTGFSVMDSFPHSTVTSNNMNLSGQFSWVPSASDVGTHVLTITGVVGAYGASASTTQTITVLGPGGTIPMAATNTPATTTTPTNPTLAALHAQLASLQEKLARSSASTGSEVSPAGSFVSYLKPGSTGEEVLHLQQVLAQQGFFSTTPNGTFGPATRAAVIAFQAAHGLDRLGVVGPATRAALNALGVSAVAATAASTAAANDRFIFAHFMGVGDDDPDVEKLQLRLIAEGFMSGSPSGYYGPLTESAVKKYQKAHGLAVTGYVASDTRAVLNR